MEIPQEPESVRVSLSPRWWRDFPTETLAECRLSWSPEALIIDFSVHEGHIRALETDPWLIHRDSCVEVFFKTQHQDDYLNIEVNPVGAVLVSQGPDRNHRRDLSAQFRSLVELSGSHVGVGAFDDRKGGSWVLEMRLSPDLVGIEDWSQSGLLEMNLYKCGDGQERPHYLSWAPIESHQPDFHRPESFELVALGSASC